MFPPVNFIHYHIHFSPKIASQEKKQFQPILTIHYNLSFIHNHTDCIDVSAVVFSFYSSI